MKDDLGVDIELRQGSFNLKAKFSAPGYGITALFGPSGSGKSTLLGVLAGLRRPNIGRICLGERVCDDGRAHLAPHLRSIGLVFQDARLFPHLTVRQNISYALRRAPKPEQLGVTEAAEFFDIMHILDRPVGNLSGGEKSRVALARALVARPDFLLLDEPFAALDGSRRHSFIRVLLSMNQTFGLPMMVVTHDIDDAAAMASHLIALNEGFVVASGEFATASQQPEFAALLGARDTGAAISSSTLCTAGTDVPRAVWLRANQVLLSSELPRAISARNVLEGHILDIITEGDGNSLVKLATRAGILLSRVTPHAVSELDLTVGKKVWGLFKAHAL